MPLVTVLGMSEGMHEQEVLDLANKLKTCTADVKELRLKPNHVSVFFPKDILPKMGKEIIVRVEGLFVDPERTPHVRQRLAECIVEEMVAFIMEHTINCQLIEVLIHPFDPKDGFSRWPN